MKRNLLYLLAAVIGLIGFSACKKDNVGVTNVTLGKTTLAMTVGGEETLVATVVPENATNKAVEWASSDTAVATVDNGVVKALAAGTAVITVTTEDSGHKATCDLTVAVSVTGVTLSETKLTLMDEEEKTLVATVLPENASNTNVTWSSSDTAVATVNNGVVKGIAEGEAIITVTTEDGNQTATCAVTVSWLGEVSFKTSTTWTIGNQTWSDAVMAVRCRKDDYHGGVGLWTTPEYRIDCRQNEGYGDWFSWRAVDTYKAQLCPDGWRVPTSEDFKNLDIAMGGSGESRSFDGAFIQKYLDEWGGQMGGYVWWHFQNLETEELYVGEYAIYWTQVEEDGNRAKALQFGSKTAMVIPQAGSDKYNGGTVRCVK